MMPFYGHYYHPRPAFRTIVPTNRRTFFATPDFKYAPPKISAANALIEVADDKKSNQQDAETLPLIPYVQNRIYRSADKSFGLRYFSKKVCDKVRAKKKTNYNEVADEIIAEYFASLKLLPQTAEQRQYAMKNIRRRVYDALNVLEAMKIVQKNKKEIQWNGLPSNPFLQCQRYEDEKLKQEERIRKKTEQMQNLVIQLIAYKALIHRNRETVKALGPPPSKTIHLPFLLLNTSADATVSCSITDDKKEFIFHLDRPFELLDDIELLKRLGLAFGWNTSNVPTTWKEIMQLIRTL